jgi:hypothetical protein
MPYTQMHVGHWLPKAAFASPADIDRFRELIAQKVLREGK